MYEDEFETEVQFLTKISLSTNGTGKEDNKRSLEITESVLWYFYSCKFDFCNNEEIENNFTEAIKDVFKNTPMYQVLRSKFQQEQTTTSIISSTNKLTTSKTRKTSTSNPTTKKHETSISTNNPTTDHLNNASILYYISMDIFILHILFLFYF